MSNNNFLSYYSSLKGWVPKLPIELAKDLVNQARRDIYDSRLWSFLIVQTQITCPALIATGSMSFVQYQRTVTADAQASAALTGLSNPVLTMRQLRQGFGPLYNIVAADFSVPTAIVLTLDRPFQEPTSSGQAYNVYQAYYPPTKPEDNSPTGDFIKWLSVFDPINGYNLGLNKTQEWLNRKDPVRGDVGQPYQVVTYKQMPVAGNGGINPIPYFELWPHPTDGVSRIAFYKTGAQNWVSATDALPWQVPVELLDVRARLRAYEWAEANKGTHPELQKTNWMAMRTGLMNPADRSSYPYLLAKCKAEDENRMPINFCSRPEGTFRFPIDSNFLQAHAFSYDYPDESI